MRTIEQLAQAPRSKHSMTNFDHSIDEGLAEDLKAGMLGNYAAENFNGDIWYDDGKFHCAINRYHYHVATLTADTLQEIMDDACEQFGDE